MNETDRIGAQTEKLDRSDITKTVIFITSEIPWPLNTGGHLRTFYLLQSLARRFQIRLLTAAPDRSDPGIQAVERLGVTVLIYPKKSGRRITDLFRAAYAFIKGEPYVMYQRHNHKQMRELIRREMSSEAPDIIYLDHLDPLVFRVLFPDTPMVTDLHNVYSKLVERVADGRHWPLKSYLKREARLLAKTERRAVTESAAVMAVSSQERDEFQAIGGKNVHLVPNGVNCDSFSGLATGRNFSPPILLYLGALSWQPNAEAADFIARQVMPEILTEYPDAILQIVGRTPGPGVMTLSRFPGVQVYPDVPDIGIFLERASILAVPLDSGGGTRLKILEAFAAGLPVVSTPVGCEGIDCVNGEHLLIAERKQFAEAILNAIRSAELTNNMAGKGRQLAYDQYDWAVIGEKACTAVASAACHS